jgi:hypothetical protein
VFYIAPAFEHERFEAFFGEFLGGPAAGNSGADDDGIEGVTSFAFNGERVDTVEWVTVVE